MSMEAQTVVSPYSRSCQAAHILGRVLEHVNEHPDADNADYHFQEAKHIARAGEALLTMIHDECSDTDEGEGHPYFLSRALCYSALLVLYDVHSCIEVDDVECVGGNRGLRLDLQQLAINSFKTTITQISAFALEVDEALKGDQSRVIGPLVAHCLYSAGGTYAWYYRETGEDRHLESLQKLRGTLESLKSQWSVASKFLYVAFRALSRLIFE